MAPPAISSPMRTTVGSSRMAICNASLIACWYVIVRVAVSATIPSSSASRRALSETRSVREVDVGESLFRLREGRGFPSDPGVVELLRHARVDRIELLCTGDATVDDCPAQRGNWISLFVE